jgi:hypothetical protein
MADEPTYYRLDTDNRIGDILDDFNEEDTVHFVTDKVVDPYDTGDDYYDEHAARATTEEHAAWKGAYETFASEIKRADDNLATARAMWEKAQAVHSAAYEDAWNDYASTDAVIYERQNEVVDMRRQREADEREAEARAAQEAKDREDAELGPRTWVTYHPSSMYNKVRPDMMVPVIHLAGCKLTRGAEDRPYSNEYRYARKEQVQETLLAGAYRYERGRKTTDKLPTKLCGRCKPHESLRKALGAVYDEWLAKVESTQEEMPTAKGAAAALGLKDEWHGWNKSGFTYQSAKYYREEKLIEPHEELVGWFDRDRNVVVPNAEKLAYLEQVLPERGFAVRRVPEPARYYKPEGTMCETAVAVRRMTKAEIRQRKEDAAALARHRENSGPAAVQNLEG